MNKSSDAQTIRIESLYSHLAGNLIATLATSILLAFYLSKNPEINYAIHWLLGIGTLTLLRLGLLQVNKRFSEGKISTEKAALVFGVGAFLGGCSWGAAFFVVPSEITLATTYVAIFVACVMALTCNTYQASSSAVIAFNMPIVAIVVFRFAVSEQGQTLAVGVLIYGALLTFNAVHTARRIHREIELKFSNEILIKDLAKQKTKSENLNLELESKVKQRTESLYLLNNELREEITERKQIEDELLASEARFRALYHEHPSILLTIDSDGFITNINDYGANYLGYNHASVVRKKFSELSTSSDDVMKLLNAVLRSKNLSENRNRLELVKSTGEVITTQATARKVPSTEQEPDKILIVCEDVTEIDLLQQRLAYHASRDTLTALYNRREFENRINQLFERAKRHGGEHVVCFIDLDRFKLINDTSGHIAGDEILKSISEAMNACMRQSDVLARLGGDEFGILMEDTSLADATQIIERLRNAIQKIEMMWDGAHHKISASFGLTELTQTTGSVDDILRDADAACYLAKKSGRNCIRTIDAERPRQTRNNVEQGWSLKLRDAVDEGKFVLALQPVFNRSSKEISHYEALLRIQEGPHEYSDAHLFVSAAERYGMITTLDKWTFENAIHMLENDSHFASGEKISINISATTIADKKFSEHTITLLKENLHLAERICIEIKESDILRSLASMEPYLGEIRELGAKLIIDDFGSSLISFKHLGKLDIDFVKLDPLLIENIDRDYFSSEILKSAITLTHQANITAIGKGVGDLEVADQLEELGVEYLQGYAIAEPINIASNPFTVLKAAV